MRNIAAVNSKPAQSSTHIEAPGFTTKTVTGNARIDIGE
jgi:hypothetical protein